MAWLSDNALIPSSPTINTLFNNLANDDRNWGGDVNAGGYNLGNLGSIAFASGGYMGSPLRSRQDSASLAETAAHLIIQGSTDPNKILALGYNTTLNYGWIQATLYGTDVKPLLLNSGGGPVGIGTGPTIIPGAALQIHSTVVDSQLYISSAAPRLAFGDNLTYASCTRRVRVAMATASAHFIAGSVAGDLCLFSEHVPASGFATGQGAVIIATASGNSSANTERMRIADKIKIALACLPVYANNAAAVAGGLAAGNLYRTGADPDPVFIVH